MALPLRAKRLLGRLSGEPARAAPTPRKAAPVKPGPGAEDRSANGLKSRLAAVVNGRSVIAAGSFHLLGLAEIRERLGTDWERVREKVHRQMQRSIERHIAPRDVYFPGGADDYVLVFAELEKSAAQLVCAKIAQEVRQTLLGDSETQDVGVRTVVSETDGNLRLEKSKLSDLVASAAAMAAAPVAEELAWSETPILPASESSSTAVAGPPEEILYRPIWDVQHEVLSTYFSRRGGTSRIPGGLVIATPPDELAQADLAMLRSGIEMLTELDQNRFRLRLSFPVSFEAVASPPRFRTYIELCRTIPDHLRKLAAFELVDLPSGVPYGRLAELAAALRPYCGLIIATVDWWRTDLSQYANTGIRVVNSVIAPGTEERRTLADMDRFARAAEKAGLQSAVEGITTSSLALAAKGAGIGFISGDRIGPCLEVPQHMLRFAWSELYFGKPQAG
jgi:hypothetical protein